MSSATKQAAVSFQKELEEKIAHRQAVIGFDIDSDLSIQDRHVSGEERWQTLGLVGGVVVLVVAHTYREESDAEVIRIISARKATTQERQTYESGY